MYTQPAIKSQLSSHSDFKHTLTIDPLLPGYGYTLGNSLRRIMLSSIPGFAVTKIKINDITHEYQALEGIVEDAIDVILNLKSLRTRIITDDESVVLELNKSTDGEVTAKDFEKNAKVEILNSDLYICTVNKGINLNIELTIERGVGYLSVDQINFSNSNPQEIVVDALFSSVSNVSLNVEKTRVGENTNYDKVIIDFITDGTVEPEEIVDYSLDKVIETFTNIKSSLKASTNEASIVGEKVTSIDNEIKVENNLDQLELPKTLVKILEKNNISNLEDIKSRMDEISDFPGITEAHIKKIEKLFN
jgi:DNA-directed RNA polymerase subunit alpha